MLTLAMDVDTLDEAKRCAHDLHEHVDTVKVGLELLTAAGAPQVVAAMQEFGVEVMYDGKFLDIDTTVGKTVRVLSRLNKVSSFTFHASNSRSALEKIAAEQGEMISLGVTVLTSIDEKACIKIFGDQTSRKVMQFAKEVKRSGCRGVVCSPQHLKNLLLEEELQDLKFVTPGVRPTWASSDDQKEAMTPGEAIKNGASALVIGRPIMKPPPEIGSRVEAAKRILDEINDAMAKRPSD
jgi:orotidine-5'-phosphate decarboxylase